jgi:Glycosyl hydrolase catalytic core
MRRSIIAARPSCGRVGGFVVVAAFCAAISIACSRSLVAPSAVRRGGSDHFGIVTQSWSPNHARWVDELGTGWVRLDFNWYEIEPARRSFTWTELDGRVLSASAQGLRIYATLAYTPAWAGACTHCMPDDLADWRDFVEAVLAHYRGIEIVLGIWNEPNLGFLNDTPDGAQYARLFEEANLARRRVDPSRALAGPETSHHAWPGYFQAVVARIQPSMRPSDVVTVHYYPDAPIDPRSYMAAISQAAGRQVWLTETGMGTCDDEQQRRYLSDVVNAFQAEGRTWWPRMFVYVLHNGEPGCSDAIVTPEGTYRAAFLFYRDFIKSHP